MAIDRIKTGIPGLDNLIQGGFPQGFPILISGSAGSGKTIFGLQYLCYGAHNNEPGIYLTAEESKENLVDQASQFGWDLEKLEDENKVIVDIMEEPDIETILKKLKQEGESIKAERLVLDSISMLGMFSQIYSKTVKELYEGDVFPPTGRELSRRDIYYVIKNMNELNTTSLIISELPEESNYLSRDTVSEFACDGVITLHRLGVGVREFRSVKVVKLRKTDHEEGHVPLVIGKEGIEVKEKEKFKP